MSVIDKIEGTASDLKAEDWFKLPGQRVFRIVTNTRVLPHTDNIPQNDRGKIIVMYNGCHQKRLAADQKVSIQRLKPL